MHAACPSAAERLRLGRVGVEGGLLGQCNTENGCIVEVYYVRLYIMASQSIYCGVPTCAPGAAELQSFFNVRHSTNYTLSSILPV